MTLTTPRAQAPVAAPTSRHVARHSRRRGPRLPPIALAAVVYLVLSVALWWNAWSSHPTSTTTCGCGDASLFTWFIEWPAAALSHGGQLFWTPAMFHPTGVNLLANTSELGLGVPLAPVSWLFGPIATMNVASTLSTALSALAMFWLLRRWVAWAPSAFIGGLLYGFSPFVVVALAGAHLMLSMLVVPPLVAGCLDELLVRQRRRPLAVGVVLGLLLVWQFFLSTELLAMMLMIGAAGVAMVVVVAAVADRDRLRVHARGALPGLGAAAVVAVALLAYPAWFAFHGPANLPGVIWPHLKSLGFGGTSATSFFGRAGLPWATMRTLGGYQGPNLPQPGYIGWALVAVLLVGLALWRRDLRLWLFGALGALSGVLSLSVTGHGWVPWQIFYRLPVLDNVIPARFSIFVDLCAAVMLGLIVDHTRGLLITGGRRWPLTLRPPQARAAGAVAATAVAAVALVPVITVMGANLPVTMAPVVLPSWFAQRAPRLPPHQVVLPYPAAFSGVQAPMTWQAVNRMHWAMAGGGGPEGTPERAGSVRAGFDVLSAASFNVGPAPAPTAANSAAVRRALDRWGVTLVVVPNPRRLPAYEHGRNVTYAVAFFSAVIGRPPQYQSGAWVWTMQPGAHPGSGPASGSGAGSSSASLGEASFDRCLATAAGRPATPDGASACVLGQLPGAGISTSSKPLPS